MVEKNSILTELDNKTINAGVAHILRHNSVAVRRFGGKYKSKINHYGDRVSIIYNQWQQNLAKSKPAAAGTGDMMTHADLGRGSTYEQFIPLTEIGCASELISNQIMKQAMSSPERMAEFIADKIELAAARAAFEIDQKFLNDITNTENYSPSLEDFGNRSPSIIKFPTSVYTSNQDKDGIENSRKVMNSTIALASSMKWPSKRFNKLNLISASLDFKNIGIIISDVMFANLEDYYGHTFNLERTELARRFAWVEVMPIHERGFHVILIDANGYVCELDEEAPTGWDESRKGFLETWYYKWVFGFFGIAEGYNMAALTEKEEAEEEEIENEDTV